MSAKELVLLSKQKYNLLTDKHSVDSVSVHTQTLDEKILEKSVENEETSSELRVNRSLQSNNTSKAVRMSSWGKVPGIRKKEIKTKPKKYVRWIPY